MKRNELFFMRRIGDIFFLQGSEENEQQDQKMIFLNGTSTFLWDRMVEEHSIDDLVKALMDEYEVGETEALKGVKGFCAFLRDNGCLVEPEER